MAIEILSWPWWLICWFRERSCKRRTSIWVWKPPSYCYMKKLRWDVEIENNVGFP